MEKSLLNSSKNMQIHSLRGICIVAVVIIHCFSRFVELNPYVTIFVRALMNFSVGLFIFISAYLTNTEKVKINTAEYLKKRILRILPPFVFFSVFYTCVFNSYNFDSLKSSAYTVIRIILGSNSGQLYFIVILLFYTLITPVLIKIIESKNKFSNLLMFSIAPIFLIYGLLCDFNVHLPSVNSFLPEEIVTILPFAYFICYYLGLYFKINGFPKFNSLFLIPVSFALVVVSNIIEYKFLHFDFPEVARQQKLNNIIFIISIVINFNKILDILKKCNTKVFCKVADYSFGIYFVHPFIIYVLFKFVNLLYSDYSRNIVFSYMLAIVAVIFTLCLSWLWIDIMNKLIKPKFLRTFLSLN